MKFRYAYLVTILILLPSMLLTGKGEEDNYSVYCAVLFSAPDEASMLGYAHPARSVGLFRREIDGSWHNVHHPNLFSYGLGYSHHNDTFRLYIAGGNGLHRSSDDGKSWKVLTGWTTEDILSVAPHLYDSTIVYVSTPFGVFKTSDDGQTWREKMEGMERWFVQKVVIDIDSAETVYAAAEDDLYKTNNGGIIWEALGVGVPQILEIVQHPQNNDILLAGTEDHGVYFSHDGGETFMPGNGFPETAAYAIGFSGDGTRVYAGGYETGLWKSTDNGETWKLIWDDDSFDAIYAITVNPYDQKHIIVGTNGAGLYESTDGGVTWQHAGLYGAHVQQIKFVPGS